jgi:hypothetical protein
MTIKWITLSVCRLMFSIKKFKFHFIYKLKYHICAFQKIKIVLNLFLNYCSISQLFSFQRTLWETKTLYDSEESCGTHLAKHFEYPVFWIADAKWQLLFYTSVSLTPANVFDILSSLIFKH